MKASKELVEAGITNALGSLRDELHEKAQDIANSINQKAEAIDGGAFKFPVSCGITFAVSDSGKLSVKGRGNFGVRVKVETIECPLDDHPTLPLNGESAAAGADDE